MKHLNLYQDHAKTVWRENRESSEVIAWKRARKLINYISFCFNQKI